jgi:hypothetical protein
VKQLFATELEDRRRVHIVRLVPMTPPPLDVDTIGLAICLVDDGEGSTP